MEYETVKVEGGGKIVEHMERIKIHSNFQSESMRGIVHL
jgi:hypothetical protein